MSNAKKSRYATKRESGKMMYGPGCCAHTVPESRLIAARQEAHMRQRRERFEAIVSRAEAGEG